MSLHEGFISAIEQQPELFSAEDREELVEQSPAWSEDSEELNNDVYQWLETRPNIYKAALKNLSSPALKNLSDKNKQRGPSNHLPIKRTSGDSVSAPPTNHNDPKANLLNAVRRSFGNLSPKIKT